MNYSNFKQPKSIILIMAIFSLSFFFACEEEDNETSPVYSSLEGEWSRVGNRELIISVEGTKAKWIQFGDGWAQRAYNQGFIEPGDIYIKDIEKDDSTTWSCNNKWIKYTGSTVTDVYWGDSAKITLSEDTLFLEAWSTYEDIEYHDTATYIKKSE